MLFRQCFDRIHTTPNGQNISLPFLLADTVCNDTHQMLFEKINSKQPSAIIVMGFDQLQQYRIDKFTLAKGLKQFFEFIFKLRVPQIILDFGKIDPSKDKHFLNHIFYYYITVIYQRMLATRKLPFITCNMETSEPEFAATYKKYCERLSLGIMDKNIDTKQITTIYQKDLGLKYLELAEHFFNNSQYQLVSVYVTCAKKCFAQLTISIEIQNKLNKLNNSSKIKLSDHPSLAKSPVSIKPNPSFDEEDVVLDESLFKQPNLTLMAPKCESIDPPEKPSPTRQQCT